MRRIILLIAILAVLPLRPGISNARGADAGSGGAPDTAALEIVCTGLRVGDIAVFDVYSPEGRKIHSVALQGNGPDKAARRRIIGLKPGLYRVESANWDWAYDKTPNSHEMQLTAGENTSFSFTASRRSGLPQNYENSKLNVFKP